MFITLVLCPDAYWYTLFDGKVDIVKAEGGVNEEGFLIFEISKVIVVFDANAELGSVKVIVVEDNPQNKFVADGAIKLHVEFG